MAETRSLRILTIASEGPPTRSGIARTIAQLKNGLEARGHQVDVVAYPGVRRLVLGEVRLSSLAFKLPGLRRQLNAYDVIHVHGEAPTVSDAFLWALPPASERPPVVYTHHCDIEVGRPFNQVYNAIHHRLAGRADEVVTTTRAYGAQIGWEEKTSVIALGVDPDRFAVERPKDVQFTVLFVGQFRPYKGVPVLLRAMAQVSGARLLIAGKGPEEEHYRELAARLGVDAEFHITPSDAKLRELYQRAHVVMLPSVTAAEAFGLVLLEGMAAGCVPVASDLAGVREVLGRIGLTVPVGSATELGATLRRLRDDPALVEAMGQRARDRAAEFTWERSVTEYERLFLDLVMARRLAGGIERGALHVAPERKRRLAEVAQHLVRVLDGDRAELLFASPEGTLRSIASSECADPQHTRGSLRLVEAEDPCAEPVMESISQLAQYSFDTGEGVLLPPRPLPHQADGSKTALAIAPLAAAGEHGIGKGGERFGALAVLREAPFDELELRALLRFARHVAPILRRYFVAEADGAGDRPAQPVAASEPQPLPRAA